MLRGWTRMAPYPEAITVVELRQYLLLQAAKFSTCIDIRLISARGHNPKTWQRHGSQWPTAAARVGSPRWWKECGRHCTSRTFASTFDWIWKCCESALHQALDVEWSADLVSARKRNTSTQISCTCNGCCTGVRKTRRHENSACIDASTASVACESGCAQSLERRSNARCYNCVRLLVVGQ